MHNWYSNKIWDEVRKWDKVCRGIWSEVGYDAGLKVSGEIWGAVCHKIEYEVRSKVWCGIENKLQHISKNIT